MRGLLPVAVMLASACPGPLDAPIDAARPQSAEQPIVGGAVDIGDPATVLIGGGGVWTSGVLVSPRVVLTCGYCVDPTAPGRNFVYFGDSYLDGGLTIQVARAYPNPNYISSNFRFADIGVVVLVSDAPTTPLPFNAIDIDGGAVGTNLRVVGFGTTNMSTPFAVKKTVTTPITGVLAKELTIGTAICDGDSGGPGFLMLDGGQEVVAGIMSWKAGGCVGTGGLSRVDLYAAWIQAQIDASDAGPVDAGQDAGDLDGGEDGGVDGGVDAGSGVDGDAGVATDGGAADGRDLAVHCGCQSAPVGLFWVALAWAVRSRLIR